MGRTGPCADLISTDARASSKSTGAAYPPAMSEPSSTAVRVRLTDAPGALAQVIAAIAASGGTLRTLSTPRIVDGVAEAELEVANLAAEALDAALATVAAVIAREET